jgi:hypothetical protein
MQGVYIELPRHRNRSALHHTEAESLTPPTPKPAIGHDPESAKLSSQPNLPRSVLVLSPPNSSEGLFQVATFQ